MKLLEEKKINFIDGISRDGNKDGRHTYDLPRS